MLPAETFELKEHLLTLSLKKPQQQAEAIWKTYELSIYEDILGLMHFVKMC
jgi:hypothetical protein